MDRGRCEPRIGSAFCVATFGPTAPALDACFPLFAGRNCLRPLAPPSVTFKVVPVLAPLPDIAMHVMQFECIGLVLTDQSRVPGGILIILMPRLFLIYFAPRGRQAYAACELPRKNLAAAFSPLAMK
jgi:hypothetical protein